MATTQLSLMATPGMRYSFLPATHAATIVGFLAVSFAAKGPGFVYEAKGPGYEWEPKRPGFEHEAKKPGIVWNSKGPEFEFTNE